MSPRRTKRLATRELLLGLLTALVIVTGAVGFYFVRVWRDAHDPLLVQVTGYCNCGQCCGWTYREGSEVAVYSYGKMKGQEKAVGVTSSGTRAKKGTVAADLSVFPYGTRLEIPGYGIGTVEDIGGAIQGRHIDVWFSTHAEARRWGKRYLKVKILNQSDAGVTH